MIRVYLEFAKKAFQTNIVYRLEYFAGLINTIVLIFVNISIWKAIYEEEEALDGVQFKILITYIALGILMQSIFAMEEYIIQEKVISGAIATDIMKPISFRLYVFSYNIGKVVFSVIMQIVPLLIVSVIVFGLLPPFSTEMALLSFLSAICAFMVLYNLNFIIWVTAFWFYRINSFIEIKNAIVMVLSGALIPLWFMPEWIVNIINMTPFGSIYYVPLSIYLGQIPLEDIGSKLLIQLVWIVVLMAMGHILWNSAKKRLAIQGG